MKTVSIDVSAEFLEDLFRAYPSRNRPGHGLGRCEAGWSRPHRDYRQTIEKFLESDSPVALVLLDGEDVATRISSGFNECIRRNGIRGVRPHVRKGLLYLVKTEQL